MSASPAGHSVRGKGPYPYPCPTCGETVLAVAAYHARQQSPCRPCIRIRNAWTCRECGSADPRHPSPCIAADAKATA